MKSLTMAVLLGVLSTASSQAQTIRGRVLDSVAHAPVSGALVEIRDSSARPIAQAITSQAGTFRIRLAQPGRVVVRVAAIGFRPHQFEPIDLTSSGVELPDLVLDRAIIALPDLVATGSKRSCKVSDTSATILGQLLANARNALQVIDGVWQSHAMQFDVESVHRMVLLPAKGGEREVLADTTRRALQLWPIQSLPPDSLRSAGFGWATKTADGPGRVYWGPDLPVLFSDWFLASHCFSLTIAKQSKGAPQLHLKFEPEQKSKLVDISGDMVLDQATLALASLSYEHRNLPDEIPDGSAGGTMAFARLDNGAWVPTRWAIWAPIQRRPSGQVSMGPPPTPRGYSVAASLPDRQPAVIGREENTGRVVKATQRPGN